MICVPVPISEKLMTIRRILRCVSMPQDPIRMRRRPVVRTMVEIIKRRPFAWQGLGSKSVENDAQLATDLDTQKDRQDRNGTSAEEGAELPKREDPGIQKAAGHDQPRNACQHKKRTGHGLRDAEEFEIGLVWRIGQ